MDAFELLKADHRKVAQLFDQLESADGRAKLRVFEQIRTELELHTHIEETIFYPALEKPKQTHDLTLEAYEEHDVVKKLLEEMSKAGSVDDQWEAQAKVLRENVEHHVEEEENELFNKAEDVLTQDDIDDLGSRMQAEKQRQLGQGQATKSTSKKAASTKKAAKKAGGSKGRSSKKATKSSKKSGTKKSASASKSSSRSTAAKTTRKSGAKKSAKKSGKKSGRKTAKKR